MKSFIAAFTAAGSGSEDAGAVAGTGSDVVAAMLAGITVLIMINNANKWIVSLFIVINFGI
ncbi:hypothetical protein D3H65_13560 [Paraflavitalea soli]|uniref:Uncharacterized protein n=1 Tax=Paraflavitalea soli TaxID=2315862 RepID=A0A3B7MX67_9BACT|nr:hypothetical protein D3H65_13560 [Paraflavitalea soli]